MSGKDGLRTYRGRRHFDRTAEPEGAKAPRGPAEAADGPRFVVQFHDATRMHADVRLEVDGVLRSWAVPKGPSGDPRDKRLAVPTEDHPLDYADFEGVIPAGEYGGGTVIVWDRGTYEPLSHDRRGHPVDFARSLDEGHATFRLSGSKLHGTYALTRIRGRDPGDHAWLLVKAAEPAARAAGRSRAVRGGTDPRRARSVLTGRTLRQVEREEREH